MEIPVKGGERVIRVVRFAGAICKEQGVIDIKRSISRLPITTMVIGMVLTSSVGLYGQTAASQPAGVPDDWSHHHLVFSDPGTAPDALAQGRIEQWYKITSDPRFRMQQMRRSLAQRELAAAPSFAAIAAQLSARSQSSPKISVGPTAIRRQSLKRDWSMNMGAIAASQTGTVTSNGATGSSSVTIGGQVLTASAPTSASQTGIFASPPPTGSSITIVNGANTLTLTTNATTASYALTFTGAANSTGSINIAYQGGASTNILVMSPGATNTCTSSTLGTFINSTVAATRATNFNAAINACHTGFPAVGVTSALSGAIATLTADLPGNFLAAADSLTNTSGALTAGTNGSSACATSTAGTYVTSNSTATLATNLNTTINACPAAAGITSTAGPSSVTVTARTAGTGGNSVTLTPTSGFFAWAGGALTGGSDGTQSGTNFAYWSVNALASTTQLAANLAAAINANTTLSGVGGVSATSNSNVVTVIANSAGTKGNSITLAASLTGFAWAGSPLSGGAGGGGTVGAGIYPAKYSFDSGTAFCDNAATPDFVVYNTGLAGSATEPTIVAYDNLYSGCPTTSVPVPNVYWQYYTGGTILTNPSLSLDGKQVAFVQTNGSSQAQLVLLKWSRDIAIQSLTSQASASAYTTCTAPCMYAITFSQTTPSGGALGTPNDTHSSPFYDFAHDTIYVGEDNGWVHKFNPVFNGAPAEVIASGWPNHAASAPVSSPVYDYNSTFVFVGPANGSNGASGRMHRITTTGTATVTNSGSMAASGSATTYMYADGPVVDSSAETVYAFVNADVSASPGFAAVWQIPYNFATNAVGTEVTVGQGNSANPMFIGAFDNIYMSASGPVGNLYVCGRAAASQAPTLYRIPINTTIGTPVAIDTLTTAATNCSPVTEFYNTSTNTDYIFLSVNGSSQTASPVACPSNATGCIVSFNVTSALAASAATTARLSVTGGTSGIVVDNAVGPGTLAGASQVYFSPLGSQSCAGNSAGTAGLGSGGCAIQASQSGLN